MEGVLTVLVLVLAALCALLLRDLRRARHISTTPSALARAAEQQQLTTHAAQASALAEATQDAVLILDPEARVLHLNHAAHTLFPAAKLSPPTPPSLITVTRHPELDQLATAALHGQEAPDRRILLGEQIFRAHIVPIAPPTGGAVLTLHDISELQRLGRARRDMVANISHELRTPITTIRLLVDTLTTNAAHDPALVPTLLAKIGLELDALQQLAQEMLDLAELESGRALLKLVPCDCAELVHATVLRFTPQAERKHLTLISTPPPGPLVLADPDQVQRVLGNLLHNAIKYTPAGGQITLAWEAAPDTLTLSVHDTGPGIPPADQARIFERFYRADRARTGEGTGLGLAIARHVVQAHGGRIWVESTPGHGTTFKFTLPRETP